MRRHRLTETALRDIIRNSVSNALDEGARENRLRRLVREAVGDAMDGHMRQERVKETAKEALRKIGYAEIRGDGDDPRTLRFHVDGFDDEDRIVRTLRNALKPNSPYDLTVETDSDPMGVNYYCKVILPPYTRCRINP